MFIDGIDIEYCLNLNSHGYQIMRVNSVEIDHNLGDLFYKNIHGHLYLCTNHNYIRRYYIMRNYHYIFDLYKDYNPFSYTHLDVYKRQELYSTDDFQELCQFLDKVGKDNIPLGTWIDLVKNTDMIIFFDSALNDTAIKKAKEINPNIQIYVYFWNPINDQNKELLTNPYIDKFYTYDKKDAKKYKINYNAQFYTTKIKLRKRKKEYDI